MATLLELDLTAPLLATPPTDPVTAALSRRRVLLRDVVDGLARAAADPEVVGLVAHVGGHRPIGPLAQVQEVRDAVRRFAASGKPTVAWTESFGELDAGTVPYYLATGFDQIWLQPSGAVGLTGVAVEAVFVKNTMDKLGVVPQLGQRHEYKNAADIFCNEQMTDAHREVAERLAASAMDQLVSDVAQSRGLTPQRVRDLVDEAPIGAEPARTAGLVDRLGYRDEVYTDLRRQLDTADDTLRIRFVHRYHRAKQLEPARLLARWSSRPAVAVVHANGNIHLGRSGRSFGRNSIGSDSLGATLRSAAADADVCAVVLRVDSGGGSYVASDAIRREVQRVREAGKPVIVSMGTVAASGGYFIAMAADTIVAQPATLTGSIGVLGGKAVVRDLLNRAGITRDGVAAGRHAQMFSSYREFDPSEWEALNTWLDDVYADFTAKVAADRGLSREHVEGVARGRVWTGADARDRGLVDDLGGLERAVELACTRADRDRREVQVRDLPRLGLAERLRPPDSSDDVRATVSAVAGGDAGPAALLLELLGVPGTGVLTASVPWRLG